MQLASSSRLDKNDLLLKAITHPISKKSHHQLRKIIKVKCDPTGRSRSDWRGRTHGLIANGYRDTAMFGYTCRTIVIFETLKDDSLQINSLASNNCFIHRNIFQNGINTLSKMVNHFLSKRLKFYTVQTARFCLSFTSMWSKYLSNNVWRDFRLSMSVSAMVT